MIKRKNIFGMKIILDFTEMKQKVVVFLKGENLTTENMKKRDHKQLSEDIIAKQITQFELPNFDEFDSIEYVFVN
jgi:hypothetical protein